MTLAPVERIDELVGERAEDVRDFIAEGRLESDRNIYEIVHTHLGDQQRNSHEQVTLLETLEKALGVYYTTAHKLRTGMDVYTKRQLEGIVDEQVEDNGVKKDLFFSNRYALYFAGKVGLSLLEAELDEKAVTQEMMDVDFVATKEYGTLVSSLARGAAGYLVKTLSKAKQEGQEASDEDLKDALRYTFTTWVSQFNWETYKDTPGRPQIEQVKFEIGNLSIMSGLYKEGSSEIRLDDIKPVNRSDVIGRSNLTDDLEKVVKLQRKFDFELGRAARRFPHTWLIFGHPGGGKSFEIQSFINAQAQWCEAQGIPFWGFKLDSTKYATEFQNQSANRLRSTIDEVNAFPGLVMIYRPDVDTQSFARANNQMSPDHMQVMNIEFQMMDGSLIDDNGRVVIIADANFVDNMDEATMSRYGGKITMERWTKPEFFEEYARLKLVGMGNDTNWTDDDRARVGQKILESGLSNREIEHVMKDIVKNIPEWDGFDEMPAQEIIDRDRRYLLEFPAIGVIDKVDEYIETRAEMEEESARKRMELKASQWIEGIGTELERAMEGQSSK